MQIRQKKHSIDSLFSFLLLLIFCLFTLMLAGMGSTIYRNGTAYLNENYTSRTATAYVAEKVRQHDEAGSVFMTSIGVLSSTSSSLAEEISEDERGSAFEEQSAAEELPALAFRDTIDDSIYITYVYFYDNALCELMVQEDKEPVATMGSHIVELSSLTMEPISGTDLLSVTAVGEEGNELSEIVHVSGGLEDLYEKK